jgi:hypothetical protein
LIYSINIIKAITNSNTTNIISAIIKFAPNPDRLPMFSVSSDVLMHTGAVGRISIVVSSTSFSTEHIEPVGSNEGKNKSIIN